MVNAYSDTPYCKHVLCSRCINHKYFHFSTFCHRAWLLVIPLLTVAAVRSLMLICCSALLLFQRCGLSFVNLRLLLRVGSSTVEVLFIY